MRLEEVIKRTKEFSNLKFGWDGENKGEKIDRESIDISCKLIKFIFDLDVECYSYPLSNGGVQVEFSYQENYYEIEVYTEEHLELFSFDDDEILLREETKTLEEIKKFFEF